MRLSTPNQLAGTIVEVTLGTVMATVKVRRWRPSGDGLHHGRCRYGTEVD